MGLFLLSILCGLFAAVVVIVDNNDRQQKTIMMHAKETHRINREGEVKDSLYIAGDRGNLDSIAKVIVKWEMR